MVGYKLSNNDWVTPFFVIFRSVREILLVTVFLEHPVATKWLLDIHVISIRCLQSDHQMIIMWIPCGYLVVLCLQVVVDLLPSCVNVVLKVTQPRSCRGEICPSRGDLLRSVPHIKTEVKLNFQENSESNSK